ncbi:hypothetical protein E4J66_12780 [Actinomyces viscosus]|uniref:Uncharacterized protein n=1 Tax=Actinomyces viscosus TaxID=1656 RepID=A0A448PPY6_ACTVI|nr:hypothetical protein [Actinomyces viscosus]TFH51209.1 hypothetical protein E4J66_12780 [Actinomyces viscosus]VEI18747.1 Uncharacterised protein [Actinomyces viscosus]
MTEHSYNNRNGSTLRSLAIAWTISTVVYLVTVFVLRKAPDSLTSGIGIQVQVLIGALIPFTASLAGSLTLPRSLSRKFLMHCASSFPAPPIITIIISIISMPSSIPNYNQLIFSIIIFSSFSAAAGTIVGWVVRRLVR